MTEWTEDEHEIVGHGQCHKVVTLLLILVKEMSKWEYPTISEGNHPGSPPLSRRAFVTFQH